MANCTCDTSGWGEWEQIGGDSEEEEEEEVDNPDEEEEDKEDEVDEVELDDDIPMYYCYNCRKYDCEQT